MKETILYYHVSSDVENFLKFLEKELKVEIKEIQDNDLHQKMGYLLGLPEFQENKSFIHETLTQPLLYFAHMSDHQLNVMLALLRETELPSIPYKAMMTETNLQYTFIELYKEIQKEHAAMTRS